MLSSDGRNARASIEARIETDGRLSPVEHVLGLHVVDEGMRVAPSDTLWSVSLASDVPWIARGAPAPRTSLRKQLAAPALLLDLDGRAKPPSPAPPRPGPESSDVGDHREQAEEAAHAPACDPRTLRPGFVVRDAVRLATGLVHDLPNAAAIQRALSSRGIPIELGRAPDFVALEGDEWVRSLGWPVRGGCLHAPSSPAELVLDVVRLGRARDLARRSALGMAILPSPASDRVVRLLDWRTEEQVLDDAEDVAALVRRIETYGRIGGLEALRSELETLASHAPTSREVFRLRRLLAVAEDRGGLLPRGFAALLPDMERLRGLLDRELEERRREFLAELDAEVEAERARRSSALEVLRNELAEAERAVALQRGREEAYTRAVDELRAEASERIDRRVAELAAALERRSEGARVDRERIENLAARIAEMEGVFEEGPTTRKLVAEAVLETLQDERTIGMLATRVAGALPRDGAAAKIDGVEEMLDTLVADPAAAAASLRWHACEVGIDERALHVAFAVASADLLPIFVGAAAEDAAVALARAVGGADFSTLHCDPTLIAAADLLDPKRARTDVLLTRIEAARRRPERWHAVALTSIDWSPCAYWLPALGSRRFGAEELPRNLLIVGATAGDGPRTNIPLGALRRAVPIDVAEWSGQEEVQQVAGAWSTGALAPTGGADEDRAGLLYLVETSGFPNAGLSATSLRLLVRIARAGWESLRWTAEDARASLSFVAEWLAAARDGATLSPDVHAVMKKIAPEVEV